MKNLVNKQITGGIQDTAKMLDQLQDTVNMLITHITDREADVDTIDITGSPEHRMPDLYQQKRGMGKAVIARENVEEVVQRGLREILGAQFTEKEGERLIARAYNVSLDEKDNLKKVIRLRNSMVAAAQVKRAAIEYYNTNNTLKGFKADLRAINDVEFFYEAMEDGRYDKIPDMMKAQNPFADEGVSEAVKAMRDLYK